MAAGRAGLCASDGERSRQHGGDGVEGHRDAWALWMLSMPYDARSERPRSLRNERQACWLCGQGRLGFHRRAEVDTTGVLAMADAVRGSEALSQERRGFVGACFESALSDTCAIF